MIYSDMDEYDRDQTAQLYRAIAEGRPTAELLQLFYDLFGEAAELRPPPSRGKPCAPLCHGQEFCPWLRSGFVSTNPTFARYFPWQ